MVRSHGNGKPFFGMFFFGNGKERKNFGIFMVLVAVW